MRRRNTQLIGEVIQDLLKSQQLDKRLNQTRLLSSWDKVVGANIAKYCGEKYVKNKVLFVKISSAVLRSELMLSRKHLIDCLNNEVGDEVITDIRFT
jgi:predicted nucleic acid-binding Zn ribbon protein